VKAGVWSAAVRARRIAGPAFFYETINCERYERVFYGQFFPELTEKERFHGWFQQDSATAYTARMSIQALSDVFKDRNISSGIWPAHSPSLNPCDFFFCGSLKDTVYNNKPWLEELTENILRKLQTSVQNSFKG
jgi:hypothetical protein